MKNQFFLKALCGMLSAAMLVSFAGCNSSNNESDLVSTIEIWEDASGVTGGAGDSGDAAQTGTTTPNGTTSTGKKPSGSSGGSTTKVDSSAGEKLQPLGNPYGSIPESVKGSTVYFATWITHDTNVETAQVLKDFTAKTGINIKLQKIPQDGYMSKMVSLIAANNAPDVFVDNYEFPVSLKIAQPLNNYINLKDPVWSKAHIEYGTINNKTYLINGDKVCWNFVPGMFFNKEVSEANGLKTPYDYRDEGNWNWDTLYQFMKDYSGIPGGHYGGYLAVDTLAKYAGTSMVKYNNGKFSSGIGDANLTKAFQMYADIKKNNYMMDSVHHVYLKDGSQGIFFGTSWQMMRSAINWRDTGEDEVNFDLDKFGFIEAPGPKGGKTYAELTTRAYGICKGAKNPEGAGYFLRYFLDDASYDFNTVYKKPATSKEMIERVKKANDKNGYFLDATQNAMRLVNEKLYTTTISELKEIDSAQMSAALSKKSGASNNAAKKGNNQIEVVK